MSRQMGFQPVNLLPMEEVSLSSPVEKCANNLELCLAVLEVRGGTNPPDCIAETGPDSLVPVLVATRQLHPLGRTLDIRHWVGLKWYI